MMKCGRAYFPMELETGSRSERVKGQEAIAIKLVPLTHKSLKKANRDIYKRKVIDATDLERPARIISESEALKELLPGKVLPGPYKIGLGDQIKFSNVLEDNQNSGGPKFVTRTIAVSDDGYINLFEIGRIKALNKTQAEVEDLIYGRFTELGLSPKFELILYGFKSQRIFVNGDNISPRTIPYTNSPIFLEDVLSQINIRRDIALDTKVSIIRNGKKYTISLLKTLKGTRDKIRLFPNDRIYMSPLLYRKESVLIVGETGAQRALPIDSAQRPTLSEIIFSGTVLSNVTSDFSQLYVIRKKSQSHTAYHLDISNPARITLAGDFEMRPDDIIFVATQPLSLYSRTLSQILGSTGLTLQARDTIRTEIGN